MSRPRLHETGEHRVVEPRPVGDHLDAEAEPFRRRDHVQDIRVDGRLPEAAEHDGFDMGKRLQLGHEPVEDGELHVPEGLGPCVSDARRAGQVAACGRLDVKPGQAVDVGPDLDASAVEDELQLRAGLEAELSGDVRGDVEASALPGLEAKDLPARPDGSAVRRTGLAFPFLPVVPAAFTHSASPLPCISLKRRLKPAATGGSARHRFMRGLEPAAAAKHRHETCGCNRPANGRFCSLRL